MIRVVAALTLACLVAAGFVGGAAGHSFLIRTEPEQGARLADSPASIAFEFTEPVVLESAAVTLQRSGGGEIDLPKPAQEADGSVLRLWLPELGEDIYIVSWEATSAVDAHVSAGEFAFAIGRATELIPVTTAASAPDALGTLMRWLFFVGLAAGLGALGAGAIGQIGAARRTRWARVGMMAAALAAAIEYGRVLASVGLSAPAMALGAAVGLLLLSATVAGSGRRGVVALMLAGLGTLAWALRSHGASAGGAVGAIVDAAHLAAGAMWAGMLLLLVRELWSRPTATAILDSARRYARPALGLVVLVAGAGVVSAVSLLSSLDDLWATWYGRLISLKIGLFVAALALAAGARWLALARGRIRLLRSLASLEVALLAVILVTTAILAGTPPPALATASAASLLGPPPLQGPVSRSAGLAGDMTIGASAGDGRLDVWVYDDATGGIDDVELALSATLPDGRKADLHSRPCGTGCFTQEFDLPEGRTVLNARAVAEGRASGEAVLKVDWPPVALDPSALDALISVMRGIDEATLTETVSSGPGAEATSTHTLTGSEFMDLELYGRGHVGDLLRIPGDPPGIQMYLPGSRILVELWTDERMRIVREYIVSPSHEVTRTFDYSRRP